MRHLSTELCENQSSFCATQQTNKQKTNADKNITYLANNNNNMIL